MDIAWTYDRLIERTHEHPEDQDTEYKAAGSLAKTVEKRNEIKRDVSAIANAVGGVIFFGIKERDPSRGPNLPDDFDPIDPTQFSKEWLNQVINSIQPKIVGIKITAVSVDDAKPRVVYVVEIPESTTAHQAPDHRYYRRYENEIRTMEDFEVKQVMARAQYPKIALEFSIDEETPEYPYLRIEARNTGRVYAKYITGTVHVPFHLVDTVALTREATVESDGIEYVLIPVDNTVQDVVREARGGEPGAFSSPYTPAEYGPKRYKPLLPELTVVLGYVSISRDWRTRIGNGRNISWTVHCDNTGATSGEFPVIELGQSDNTRE